ncbi:hypothetical protein BLOT_001957 [Blomia tropicalis]|nr:hypothetical protein BLOT_001957 [Blomia tropicalis]
MIFAQSFRDSGNDAPPSKNGPPGEGSDVAPITDNGAGGVDASSDDDDLTTQLIVGESLMMWVIIIIVILFICGGGLGSLMICKRKPQGDGPPAGVKSTKETTTSSQTKTSAS